MKAPDRPESSGPPDVVGHAHDLGEAVYVVVGRRPHRCLGCSVVDALRDLKSCALEPRDIKSRWIDINKSRLAPHCTASCASWASSSPSSFASSCTCSWLYQAFLKIPSSFFGKRHSRARPRLDRVKISNSYGEPLTARQDLPTCSFQLLNVDQCSR